MSGVNYFLRVVAPKQLEICHFRDLYSPFPPHFHRYYLLGCLLAGKREFVTRDRRLTLTPFTLVLLPPYCPHSCSPLGAEKQEWLCAHASPDFLRDAPSRLQAGICPDKNLAFRFAKLCLAPQSPQTKDFYEFFAPNNFIFANTPVNPRPEFKRLLSYLTANLHNKIGLSEICKTLGKSQSALLKSCSANLGLTPYRCLEALRVDSARASLNRGKTPGEAALECGFYDQSHLCRVFKRLLGYTPGYFRSVSRRMAAI